MTDPLFNELYFGDLDDHGPLVADGLFRCRGIPIAAGTSERYDGESVRTLRVVCEIDKSRLLLEFRSQFAQRIDVLLRATTSVSDELGLWKALAGIGVATVGVALSDDAAERAPRLTCRITLPVSVFDRLCSELRAGPLPRELVLVIDATGFEVSRGPDSTSVDLRHDSSAVKLPVLRLGFETRFGEP